jgi:putative spermidine/putrescine transport system permease protein
MKAMRRCYLAFVAMVYAFLLAPLAIVVLASFNAGAYLTFPPQGLSLRWYGRFFDSQPFMDAFAVSLKLGLLVATIATVLGTCVALYLVRFAGRWRDVLRLLVMAPILLPEVLTGIALLFFFYQTGIGTKTFAGLLIGHVLICVPFVFLVVSSALYNFDVSLEEAARGLGASRFTAFRKVTLPLIKPGVIAGAMLAFIVSFDLFAISLLLKSIRSTTLPIQLFDYVRWDFDPTAAAVSTVSIAMTLSVVVIAERLVGLNSLRF